MMNIFAEVGLAATAFPKPVTSYGDELGLSVMEVLTHRVSAEPFNLVATAIFLGAIIHTFLAPVFHRISIRLREEAKSRYRKRGEHSWTAGSGEGAATSFKAELLHFLGEIEAIFGIWVFPLLLAISFGKGWGVAKEYVAHSVVFDEAIFVVVVMAIASTRPIIKLAEWLLGHIASIGGSTTTAWWLVILVVGPILGSVVTEPAAMTISALLLGEKIFKLKPSRKFAYATVGLLFVNVSIGGTLTHFAAPPVLMVASRWGWSTPYMLTHFGVETVLATLISTGIYWTIFRGELRRLGGEVSLSSGEQVRKRGIPLFVTLVHVIALGWTVFNAHSPVLAVGGFLFLLAFIEATKLHQDHLSLRSPLLVGFFLAGLVVHGGLQAWWIEPLLGRLGRLPLFLGALGLTSFNDNAAITYLATLVPNLTEELRHAVVAGAVAGGGLTIIANAPNPAGNSILSRYFPNGITPTGIFLGALVPTVVSSCCFLYF